MQVIDNYKRDIWHLLEYDDYSGLLKRIIDITLDTEDILFYKKTIDLLSWIDENVNNTIEVRAKLQSILEELFSALDSKEIKTKETLLEVKDLAKIYSGSQFILGPISLTIKEGEIIGLVGENGNGKTTLLRSLCGELTPTSGSLKYSFQSENQYDLRSKLIYIPQRTADWHGSLLSNLHFTASSYGIKGDENVYLTELIIARMGLRKYRDMSWKGLSSGYKMRFELARMLLRKPKLLLIDEPLANLDILAQQVVLDDFRNIAKSPYRPLGIVLSSQQLYEVEKTSDQVIFLKHGVPNNTHNNEQNKVKSESSEVKKLIIEFESAWSQDQLRDVFSNLSLEKLRLEGGTYIAIFPESIQQEAFLRVIIDEGVSLNYFRNISNSTRRFFLS